MATDRENEDLKRSRKKLKKKQRRKKKKFQNPLSMFELSVEFSSLQPCVPLEKWIVLTKKKTISGINSDRFICIWHRWNWHILNHSSFIWFFFLFSFEYGEKNCLNFIYIDICTFASTKIKEKASTPLPVVCMFVYKISFSFSFSSLSQCIFVE